MELSAWKLKLEESERALARRERALLIQGSKVYYKKKPQRVGGSAAGASAAQQRAGRGGVFTVQQGSGRMRNPSPSTPEVLSTSPETPFTFAAPPTIPDELIDANHNPIHGVQQQEVVMRVRENPVYEAAKASLHFNSPEHFRGAAGIDWSRVTRVGVAGRGGTNKNDFLRCFDDGVRGHD